MLPSEHLPFLYTATNEEFFRTLQHIPATMLNNRTMNLSGAWQYSGGICLNPWEQSGPGEMVSDAKTVFSVRIFWTKPVNCATVSMVAMPIGLKWAGSGYKKLIGLNIGTVQYRAKLNENKFPDLIRLSQRRIWSKPDLGVTCFLTIQSLLCGRLYPADFWSRVLTKVEMRCSA